ncbi:MAG: TSUP family transporter [Gammaproteobacteria bacterium]
MMWLAWLGAAAIGLSLGLLGSGGSILTVPILVYLVGQPEKVAIAGSLAIVGGISLLAALPWTLKRQVDWRNVAWFGLPGMAGTWLGAWASQWLSGAQQLLLFALVMLIAAVLMFRPPARVQVAVEGAMDDTTAPRRRAGKIALDGLLVGMVTGLVGVGGGFLIVPALVLLGGMAVHRAIGTSLWIIALKSFSGFAKYVGVLAATGLTLNWPLIGVFVALGAGGSVVGGRIARRLPQAHLQKAFAVFLVLMGAGIVWQTMPRAFAAGPAGPAPVPSVVRAPPAEGARASSYPVSHPEGHSEMNRSPTPSSDLSGSDASQPEGFRRPRPDLITGGQPAPGDWARLRASGIRMVVNLRTAEELEGRDVAAEARAHGLDYVSLPVDGAAGITDANARALWDLVGTPGEGVVLVHCASGNRVGALLALGAARSGALTPGQALQFGRDAGMTGLEGHVRQLLGLDAGR